MPWIRACLASAVAVAAGLALVVPGAPAAERCRPTESDVAGPFQQGLKAPRRATIGKGHVLVGRVLRAPDCMPLAGIRVILWQAGKQGYGPRGRASVVTDRSGRFRFEGPVPGSYGREPHIHIGISHPAYEELLTRYAVRPGAKRGRITLVLAPGL